MSASGSVDALPVIDASDLAGRDTQARLRQAARQPGFFYLARHGINPALDQALLGAARQFFALKDADKQAIAMVRSPHFRGYTAAGGERTLGRPDWREQIDIGAERAAMSRAGSDRAWARLIGPNQWPAALPQLRPVVERWQDAVRALLNRLLDAFALALGQDAGVFGSVSGAGSHELIKLIRYPGASSDEAGGGGQGVGAHKDGGLLSLILQDGQGGLEVQAADGRWIKATPRHGAYVVNIGELLELASDGYLKATIHRVVSPPAGHDRVSAAFFLGARLDATIRPLALPPELAGAATGVDRDPDNPLFREVGRNALKGRLRSHPDVAAAHHADLLAGDGAP